MYKYVLIVLMTLVFLGCNDENIPDVSNIKINLTTQHFEKDFFNLSNLNYSKNLATLIAKYPAFGQNFLSSILSIDANENKDSVTAYIKSFATSYKSIYDTSLIVFNNFNPIEKDIKQSLQFVKYYFPQYNIPNKIITYIGPLDGYGDIIADDALLIGLQLHLGKNFSLYQSEIVQQTYPQYISNRFEPDYISINCVKNIIEDIYPEKLEDKTLVQQIIEKGKRLYIQHKILPYKDEYKIIGYTKTQLAECYNHEKIIWNLFTQNNLLQENDENIIKNYIGESPKTKELGDASPGNIGSFIGLQIVKKYMQIIKSNDLQHLMLTDNDLIFEKAKYKP